MNLLAQKPANLKPIGGSGLGPFGNLTDATKGEGIAGVVSTVSSIVGFMTLAAAIWFLFQVLYGGYQWLSSGGDPKQLQSARDRITHAFIGLTIVIAAWALLAIAAAFFDAPGLLDPESVINLIQF